MPGGLALARVTLTGDERSRVVQRAIAGLGAGKVFPSATELGDATLQTAQRSPQSPLGFCDNRPPQRHEATRPPVHLGSCGAPRLFLISPFHAAAAPRPYVFTGSSTARERSRSEEEDTVC